MKKIIEKSRNNYVDFISLTIHLLICLFLWTIYEYGLIEIGKVKALTNFYFFMIPLLLIGLLFRNLRNTRFYIIWTIVGLIQLFIYFLVKDNPEFYFPRGTAFDGLKALLPVLIMFQILRQISLKVYKREMIISIRHYRMSWYEEEEKRNMTLIEVLFSLILFGTSITFCVI